MHATLKVVSGPEAGKEITLEPGDVLCIGRNADNDLSCPIDDRMSGTHFAIRLNDDGTCDVRDLDSTNGLFMNDERVEEVSFGETDQLKAGRTRFEIELDDVSSDSSLSTPKSWFPEPSVDLDSKTVAEMEVYRPPTPLQAAPSPDPTAAKEVAATAGQPVLRAVSGPGAGAIVVLEPDAVYNVGRDATMDLAIAEDERLSSRHFEVGLQQDGSVRVGDLDSSNGLVVNGAKVKEMIVGPGDMIFAGRTEFVVAFDDRLETAASTGVVKPPPVPSNENAERLGAAAGKFLLLRQDFPTGLAAFVGQEESPSPLELANLLAKDRPLYVIADLIKFGEKLPPTYDADILFDWLPQEWIAQFSPILVSPDGGLDPFDLIERGWGTDGLVCVFTSLDRSSLLALLRAAARGPVSPDDPPSASDLVGCCWPASLSEILSGGRPESVQTFAALIDAFLVEAKSPGGWQIFAQPAFEGSLEGIGFSRAEPEPAGTKG